MILKIKQQNNQTRLDKFLAARFSQYSRSYWQNYIKQQLVLVNKRNTTPHYLVKDGDQITINNQCLAASSAPDLTPNQSIALDIIHEDVNVLIINKPANLIVHPTAKTTKPTLANALLAYNPDLAGVGDNTLRPGIVHRLDKDVSGLIIIAKTPASFNHLKTQFANQKVQKTYLALVHGRMVCDQKTINQKIGRAKSSQKWITGQNPAFRVARTEIEITKRYNHFTLIKARPLTGRTHQIRVHLKSIGHPIVGDQLYTIRRVKAKIPLNRLFLHATQIGFYGIDGAWQEFSCPLPLQLNQILTSLK